MSVYAIADLHGQLPQVPEDAEALLIAGDICPDFHAYRQSVWLDTTFRAWLAPIVERGCQVVAIWGNHDFVGERPEFIPKLPWTLLQDSEITLDLAEGPLRIYGTPWVPGLPYWAFCAREPALKASSELIPEGLDVLMSHGPPFGAGDFIPTSEKQQQKYGNFSGERVGNKALGDAIRRARPRATICGHIHADRGVHYVPACARPVCNVAAVDDSYHMREHPFVALKLL